ncbi:MAG: hypothetical protein COA78_04810 [Blastopirellula sp.]|nr:MAG: hypothetical protein COA78_04810 [Blastopirellula sp.]
MIHTLAQGAKQFVLYIPCSLLSVMTNKTYSNTNLHQQRLDKENRISESDIEARMRWDMTILSTNAKGSVSLDLP